MKAAARSRPGAALAALRERPTLAALVAAWACVLALSLAAAAGVGPRWARLALVLAAWAALTGLWARVFLPDFAVPRGTLRRAGRSVGRQVALTFDDGPHPESTPALLDALAATGTRATFFLVGDAIERWPDLARRIVAAGHAVGNHTQRHRLLPLRTARQLDEEIGACQRALAAIGVRAGLFRPPHGFRPVGLARALARHGLRLVTWQGSIRDTDAPGVESIVERAAVLAAPGRILLLHDSPSCRGQTAAALPAIVARYRALGYELVALG